MNERIQQLAEQALQLVADEHTDGDESRLNTDSYHVKDLIQEKFAELIVGECVNMIEAAAEHADEEDVHGMRNAAGLISRAFITFHDADLKNELANR